MKVLERNMVTKSFATAFTSRNAGIMVKAVLGQWSVPMEQFSIIKSVTVIILSMSPSVTYANVNRMQSMP